MINHSYTLSSPPPLTVTAAAAAADDGFSVFTIN